VPFDQPTVRPFEPLFCSEHAPVRHRSRSSSLKIPGAHLRLICDNGPRMCKGVHTTTAAPVRMLENIGRRDIDVRRSPGYSVPHRRRRLTRALCANPAPAGRYDLRD